jgi:hypothetical protein
MNVDQILERHLERIQATEDVYNEDELFGEPEYDALYAKALDATRAEVVAATGSDKVWSQWRNDKARDAQRRARKRQSRSHQAWFRRFVREATAAPVSRP